MVTAIGARSPCSGSRAANSPSATATMGRPGAPAMEGSSIMCPSAGSPYITILEFLPASPARLRCGGAAHVAPTTPRLGQRPQSRQRPDAAGERHHRPQPAQATVGRLQFGRRARCAIGMPCQPDLAATAAFRLWSAPTHDQARRNKDLPWGSVLPHPGMLPWQRLVASRDLFPKSRRLSLQI